MWGCHFKSAPKVWPGARLYVAEAEVFDGEGRSVVRGSGTFMRSQRALSADMGYG